MKQCTGSTDGAMPGMSHSVEGFISKISKLYFVVKQFKLRLRCEAVFKEVLCLSNRSLPNLTANARACNYVNHCLGSAS